MRRLTGISVMGLILVPLERPAPEKVSSHSAAEVGLSPELLAELSGNTGLCGCTLNQNTFTGLSMVLYCSDDGSPTVTSLTESIACIPPSGDMTQCTVTGTVTWTPGCLLCCGSSACEWNSGSPNGSNVSVQNTSYAGSISYWLNCVSGAKSVGSYGDCAGFGGPTTITVRGTITQCGSAQTLTCNGITWAGLKQYTCN